MQLLYDIVNYVGGTDGVAIYATGWRVITMVLLPLFGMATAIVSITGAAFGQRDYKKISTVFMYALKIGIIIEVLIAIALFLLSPQITAMFTRAEGAVRIADDLMIFLKIMSLFYPSVALGMFSSAMFQGTGKGMNALIVTIIRTVVLTSLFVLIFVFTLGMGLLGVWFGIVIGNIIGATMAFLWAKVYIRSLMATMRKEELSFDSKAL